MLPQAVSGVLRNSQRRPIGRTRAIILAVLVHAVIISLLLLSFRWQSQRSSAPAQKVIQAHVMDDAAARQAAQKLKQQLAQKLKQQLAQKLKQQEQEQEQERQQQLLQQQELARSRQKQTQAKAKQKAALLEKQHAAAAAEKLRQAALQKQMQKQAEQREQQQAVASLKRQLAAEEKQRQQAAAAASAAAKAQSAIDLYKGLIQQKVERNWVRPPDTQKNMECVVRVKLVPGGDVIEAHVVRSSGNPIFDRSVENAVYKASPLPLPDDKTLFDYFRELEFTFKPET